MGEQQKLFDVASTRRRLKDDEVYCPACRAVSRQMSDYPDCPMCDGPVRTSGAVIDFAEIREDLVGGRATTRRMLVGDEVYCPDCLAVGHGRDDCLFCGGDVLTAGAIIENLPGGAHMTPPWGRAV